MFQVVILAAYFTALGGLTGFALFTRPAARHAHDDPAADGEHAEEPT